MAVKPATWCRVKRCLTMWPSSSFRWFRFWWWIFKICIWRSSMQYRFAKITFFDLCADICQSETYSRITTISSRQRPGLSSRWSQSTSNISGVTVRLRPTLVGKAWTLPNCSKFLRIFLIVGLLQSASSAIWEVVSDRLSIISRMRCSLDGGSLGAMSRGATWDSLERKAEDQEVSARKEGQVRSCFSVHTVMFFLKKSFLNHTCSFSWNTLHWCME